MVPHLTTLLINEDLSGPVSYNVQPVTDINDSTERPTSEAAYLQLVTRSEVETKRPS